MAELQMTIAAEVSEKADKIAMVGRGHVAELVYAYVSEAYPVRVGSSSLPVPTWRKNGSIVGYFLQSTFNDRSKFL